MRTVGVDLAASPRHTAVAVIEWSGAAARVVDLAMPADDARIADLVVGADRIGVDAPFGWPDDFVEFVVAHHRGELGAGRRLDEIESRRPLAYRLTDRVVVANGWGRPLSVSADQIAHVAFRAAGLITDLGVADRVNGWAVEAYPAAALKKWDLPSRGYKGVANRARLARLTEALAAAPWLELGAHREQMIVDDNAFDAVITALIARAAELGRTRLPDDADRDVAMREGWIHVPECGIGELV
ncbi:DUF429 domain-containing protein [Gordonia rhizosphera]|uniref:DUF429 domain-containing protein n=1 Tax=Gordonia rhizosphera NBRC 16068 TaxID=1108045 RepID=K6V2L6_9ACTN|nr:DUF429 domain-containing protein [Gordonia rhizosphera]GAB90248.1 hypothetical protein GORHZ_091_00060 [Gordonia rhizosphera NBRC 16068]